jgi:hypothetical protein
MRTKKGKDIIFKPKMLAETGLILAADGKTFVTAADYRFKAVSFGEVKDWGGTITVMSELPQDVEYVLSLAGEEDDRSGRIRLDSVKKIQTKKITAYEYMFQGVSPLT